MLHRQRMSRRNIVLESGFVLCGTKILNLPQTVGPKLSRYEEP